MMRIKVPATTANLGPGFDSMGLALNLFNEYELVDRKATDANTLADQAFSYYFQKKGQECPNKKVNILQADIPQSRGLGSSASLIVGGLILANNISHEPITTQELLEMAVDLEGHPDNVTPALLGGFVVSSKVGDTTYYERFAIDDELAFLAFIPEYEVLTHDARSVLPHTVTHQDAVKNVAYSNMILTSLIHKNYTNMKPFFEDYLHEPYRKLLIRDYEIIKSLEKRDDVYGVYLSGAGSTMMVITNNAQSIQQEWEEHWSGKILILNAWNGCENSLF